MNEPRFEVYPERLRRSVANAPTSVPREKTEYFWRFRAANGQITAVGGEGFSRREDAHRAVIDTAATILATCRGLRDSGILDLDE